jgi:hypothetical protein
MNIKSRLKKLENEVIDNSQFCRCNGYKPQTEIREEKVFYDAYETGVYIPYQNRPNQDESNKLDKEVLEICLRCKKPINKRVIILQIVGAEK